ncbi:hypothetical protein [Sphingopyxis sp. KK2]|uniref:hypothetical protein n=1 Tax=Sphingopyxis sp. KK2 TaxID=1855727 RepID=UPI00097E604F|nr:hypothetical protein [Sphingopyxis sp. KK2]
MLFESPETTILFWLVVAAATMFVVLSHTIRSPKGTLGFPMAMMFALAIVHIAAFVHLIPGYFHQYDPYLNMIGYTRVSVAKGLQVSTIGFVMMALGIWLMSYLGDSYRIDFDRKRIPALFLRLAQRLMLLVGLVFFFGITFVPAIAEIPTIGAVIVSGKNLLVVALCLAVLRRSWLNEGLQYWQIGAITVMIPIANLLGNAILADAVAAVIIIACFWLAIAGRRLGIGRVLVTIILSGYIFLYLSTNYLLVRGQFREVVWEPTSTLSERVDGLVDAISQFGPLSSDDAKQLYVLDSRLDQSIYTGMAVEKFEAQPDTFENGSTLLAGLFAFVPRAIWTNKPVRGGSQFVSEHTGYNASAETTFGIGPFFEFYANFAMFGVVVFSLLMGMFVRYLDMRAFRALAEGRMAEAVPLMSGLVAFIQPLANASSLFSTFYASLIIGFIIVKVMERYLDVRLFAEEQARTKRV